MKSVITFVFCLLFSGLYAQVGIGTITPNASAVLELKSSSKGLLIPRVSLVSTTDAVTVPSPAAGLLVYNTVSQNDVLPGFYYWDSSWKPLLASAVTGPSWGVAGNTAGSGNFIGTLNYNPFTIKVNNLLMGKLHPGGGISLGINALANDTKGIAIGSGATSAVNTEAMALGISSNAGGYRSSAIGYGSTASSNNAFAGGYSASATGYQSLAIGMNSSATQNNTSAVGYGAAATAYQAGAFGTEASASGQNATAIGFQATATQANSVILGSSSNADNKVGIGTNTPDTRLHVNGTFKLTDGTQANGYVLTSDAAGKASWQKATKVYGQIYYSGSGQALNQYTNVSLPTATVSNGVTVETDGITLPKAGIYRITYTLGLTKSGGSALNAGFMLYLDYSTSVPGSYSVERLSNNSLTTIEKTVMVNCNAYQKISVRPTVSDTNTTYVGGACSLLVELIE
ncbi:hypothetical protein HYN59_17690 [Flavobacterium album]|uniref:Trimeric autotransporter adhesin YadA-like head domain-containing protein n=1 Tax=Flavobacterium album TaxID=2175091 RepID=A0A2S1R2B7_9FLAO|nr:hypothetical protein [Flavobacterium album]AWH86828.1 hypothetical protein HYN59_17690 [Flavobacterium album]